MKTATTDEEKRIAIARATGWTVDEELEDGALMGTHEKWGWNMIPDFLNDLQAMDDAVTALQPGQMWKYGENLQKEIRLVWGDFHDFCRNIALIAHATARQRAEAFLKTIQTP